MADIEKVIEGVHHCYEVKGCDDCPYEEGCAYSFDNDEKPHCPIMDDILALLKEQEAKTRQLRLALDIAKGTCKGIVIETDEKFMGDL